MTTESDHALIERTSEIVSAFVSNNSVRADDVAGLIQTVHKSLQDIGSPKPAEEPVTDLKPAVPVKKSVTDDYIISLEDGRKFKSMKRYLGLLGMTPEQCRTRWGLPRDYPMVAPGYAAKRSELARNAGLGRKAEAAPPAPAPETPALTGANDPAPGKRRAGRPKKAA